MAAEPTPSTLRPAPASDRRNRRHAAVLLLSVVLVTAAAACGSDPAPSSAPTNVTASSGSPGTTTGTTPGSTPKGTTPKGTTPGTAPSSTTPTTVSPGTSLPTVDGGGVNSELEAAVETPDVSWELNAAAYRDQPGVRFGFVCPPGGVAGTVWGTTTYTDDSSVCTAAVHHGFITFEDGGRVVIEMRGGTGRYRGSEANGVVSLSYDEWPGSFIFPGDASPT